MRSDYQQESWAQRARKATVAKARDPERRAKIAAARIGKPRPAHVIETLSQGRTRAARARRYRRER